MSKDRAVTDSSITTSEDFIADLRWRGLIAQATDEAALIKTLDEGPTSLYCGFDPTAESLHVGNLVPLQTLRRFQLQGHPPIALVGGATGLIGDPSGRAAERTLNSADVVADWVQRIRGQVETFVDLGSNAPAQVVSNLDWTKELTAIEFLRDIGKHFSVNVMLGKDSVKSRLNEHGISYTEFSYMLLQAYDYLELYQRHNCRLQIGGSDQWGNIVAGLDLIRRVCGFDAPEAHALTVPLITKSDGTKFGKTAAGAVWLDSNLTSPYAFYQYWINTDDRDVEHFTKVFSFVPRQELEARFVKHAEAPHKRLAQRALADELTQLVHGRPELEAAKAAGEALFGRGSLDELAESVVEAALRTAPSERISVVQGPPSIIDALVASGLCESRGAARRAVKEGGAYLNNERIVDEEFTLPESALIHGRWWLLRRGKRAFASLEVQS